jgi:hypothetical protein
MSTKSHRRGTGSGRKWSDDEEGSGAEQDDKQSKADLTEVHTGRFVVGLLFACCVACAYLVLSHMGRGDVTLPGKPQAVAQIRSNIPPAGRDSTSQIPPVPPHEPATHNSIHDVAKTTTGDRVSQEKAPPPASLHGDVPAAHAMMQTPITWPGCLYELPDPNKAPGETSDPGKPIRNKKNRPGYDYNREHIVPPPAGPVKLVCCNTTKGPLNIEVHPTWAPNGAGRFLEMVPSVALGVCSCVEVSVVGAGSCLSTGAYVTTGFHTCACLLSHALYV